MDLDDILELLGSTPRSTGRRDAAAPLGHTLPGFGIPLQTRGSLGRPDAASTQARRPIVLPTSDTVDAAVFPEQYMELYRELDVEYVDRTVGTVCRVEADVHQYINFGLSSRQSNETEKNSIQQLVRRESGRQRRSQPTPISVDRRGHNVAIAHAYYGKGQPWEYQVYLAYALTFGRVNPAGLADYCDDMPKLGLDCSGFVNCFLRATGRTADAQHINSYARNTARHFYAEIQRCDLLIWQQNATSESRHIAIVDRIIAPDKIQVVESSGSKEGLASSEYVVNSVTDEIFSVHRGLKADGTRYPGSSNVRIVAYE